MPAVTGQRVLCLGCVQGVLDLPHQCAGDAELVPYGGFCQCPRPDCRGGRASTPYRESGRTGGRR